MDRQGERATGGRGSSLAWESYLEGGPGDVPRPNARMSPPSSRETVTYVEKQGVVRRSNP